ncbi:Uu.00g142740.m01.CDS01 [Anthostomella pinea]|uniref:Uu.00g142740.m01.CDS01 n=1 Tax=Anthostomella pinea TaxID=933095 RepID=A0AAI8VQI9_9PEZI|nr:Uu.00g142740.m01.CDS01 [Anthostomella pinea]
MIVFLVSHGAPVSEPFNEYCCPLLQGLRHSAVSPLEPALMRKQFSSALRLMYHGADRLTISSQYKDAVETSLLDETRCNLYWLKDSIDWAAMRGTIKTVQRSLSWRTIFSQPVDRNSTPLLYLQQLWAMRYLLLGEGIEDLRGGYIYRWVANTRKSARSKKATRNQKEPSRMLPREPVPVREMESADMATPFGALPYDPTVNTTDEPAAKRLKTLACLRCRRRKQKCDDSRPCANCTRSGEDCHEVAPRSFSHVNGIPPTPQVPLSWIGDIPSLEERVSRLERSLRPDQYSLDNHEVGDGFHAQAPQARELESARSLEELKYAGVSNGASDARALTRSSPAIGLLATFARSEEMQPPTNLGASPMGSRDLTQAKAMTQQGGGDEQSGIPVIDVPTEQILFDTYYTRIHCRYPFLRLDHFRDPAVRPSGIWAGYFTNMIFSIGLLLGKSSELHMSTDNHQAFYRLAVTRYLSHVFAQQDRLLHIQAYLLLAMHALYSPSTERIISIASATMRYCVMSQLHLAGAEPSPMDVNTKVQVQTRRRVFWSAYALDRAVGTMFDLPFSIPDYQITVKLYANIDDGDLDDRCQAAFPEDPQSQPSLTSVSAALHVVYCRQIQSEILNTTLHRDFAIQFDRLSNWRLRILEKLDRWRSLCHRYSDSHSRSYTSSEWLHMIYNYSLAMLYRPTKSSVKGPAGDWTVKCCVQACLIFRRFQKENTISEAWLALLAQFKCGVALLYCFFATPPQLRSVTYHGPDVSEAVRACSIILSLLAERWPQSAPLRDCFDILAKEIPLSELPAEQPGRIRQDSADALISLLTQLETIVVHRDTLRMIKEMATEPYPRPTDARDEQEDQTHDEANADDANHGIENDAASLKTTMTGDIFQPMTPHFFLPELVEPEDGLDYAALGFPGIFDPGVPF